MSQQTSLDEWINSMLALLNVVGDDDIQSYSISIVPAGLKESNKDHHHPVKKDEEESTGNKHEVVHDVYMPRVVSMGPRFKGTREDLLLMEEVKIRCMLSLIYRADQKSNVIRYMVRCCRMIWHLIPEIRATYVADINHIQTPDLAKMMLVDGCFLLELLISKGSLNDQLPSRLRTPPHAPQVLQNEEVLCDLILFENQIPMFVLFDLSRVLFPDVFEEYRRDRAIRISNLALAIFGFSLPPVNQTDEPPHILDVVHFFVNTKKKESKSTITTDHVMDIPLPSSNLKLKLSASRLLAAGIPIKVAQETKTMRNCFGAILTTSSATTTSLLGVPPPSEETVIKGLDFDFKFQNGELEIAQLHIKKTTKATWRNIIVWEHHHKKRGRKTPTGKFTSAAWVFHSLICCTDDVKLLKKKNIIVDHTEMGDEELEAFFHSLSFGVDHGIVDSKYVKLVTDLNIYSRACSFIRMWRAFCHFLRSSFKLFRKAMTKTYSFLLSLVVFLTFVQTVYAILAYHQPPK